MPAEIPQGDLARTKTIEANSDFPDILEIRLEWRRGSKVKERVMRITSDEFFGRGAFGAPMGGDAIVQHIDRMRRLGQPK